MLDKNLYAQILGIKLPWTVKSVDLNLDENKVEVSLDSIHGIDLPCPHCDKFCPIYDHKIRKWRHLDTCQLQTILISPIPRVECKEHGVSQISVPWGEERSPFTAMFERLVIDWLKVANIKVVANMLNITWDQADGVRSRAIKRGLERRKVLEITHLGIDETSFQKRHEYVTVVMDKGKGVVLEVLDGRTKEVTKKYFETLPVNIKGSVESISMDMWPAYINATLESFPESKDKICFDRFHVSQKLCNAVNKVRTQELKILSGKLLEMMIGTKHDWLRNSDRMDNRSRKGFMELTKSAFKTARAWAMKETASKIWNYRSKTWAIKAWRKLIKWMKRSQLKPMIKVANTIKKHLWGILNAIDHNVSNASLEGINTRIQKIKSQACGFRNRDRFRETILFNFGGLDLYPAGS